MYAPRDEWTGMWRLIFERMETGRYEFSHLCGQRSPASVLAPMEVNVPCQTARSSASGLCECPDLFAFFGAFSVTRSVYPAERIAAALEAAGDECPVLLFYSVCGQQDKTAYASAKALAENLPGACGQLTADHRIWQEVPGGHDFSVWYLGLYNFLRLAAN